MGNSNQIKHTIIGCPYLIDNSQIKPIRLLSRYLVVLPLYTFDYDLRLVGTWRNDRVKKINDPAVVATITATMQQFIAASRKVARAVQPTSSFAPFVDIVIAPDISEPGLNGYSLREILLRTLFEGDGIMTTKANQFPGGFRPVNTRIDEINYPVILSTHITFDHIKSSQSIFMIGL